MDRYKRYAMSMPISSFNRLYSFVICSWTKFLFKANENLLFYRVEMSNVQHANRTGSAKLIIANETLFLNSAEKCVAGSNARGKLVGNYSWESMNNNRRVRIQNIFHRMVCANVVWMQVPVWTFYNVRKQYPILLLLSRWNPNRHCWKCIRFTHRTASLWNV